MNTPHELNRGTGKIPTRETQPNGRPLSVRTIERMQEDDWFRQGVANALWVAVTFGGLWLLSILLMAW